MFKKRYLLLNLNIILLILLSSRSVAQNKYWVEFADDLAKSSITQVLERESMELFYYSEFLEAYSLYGEEEILNRLLQEGIVTDFQPVVNLKKHAPERNTFEYAFVLEQIRAWYLTDSLKLSGKGIKIGVIDGGFMAADKEPALAQAFKNEQLKHFTDYLMKGNTDPFYGKRLAHDDHGTEVLKMIIGKNDDIDLQTGMAPDAQLYLARTDHGIRENRLEEDYWVMALERFYDMGVRLVNSSLGYTDDYDKKKENHKVNEVDGKTSMITQAAQKAAEKGMLLVISAGNDGSHKWKVISLPADAKGVMAVGSTNFGDWSKMSYSSIGPEKLAYVKPDISCFAANGTSYSAPVITGLAACIWQYDSTLTNYDIMEIIKNSGHLSRLPNNYLGYGVPDCENIKLQLQNKPTEDNTQFVSAKSNSFDLSTYKDIVQIEYFHKQDSINVSEHGIRRRNDSEEELIIERPDKKVKYTTVTAKDELVLEIIWPEK